MYFFVWSRCLNSDSAWDISFLREELGGEDEEGLVCFGDFS